MFDLWLMGGAMIGNGKVCLEKSGNFKRYKRNLNNALLVFMHIKI